jgi:hypothetical protein
MANTDWNNLKGRRFNVTIGGTKKNALADNNDDSVLHICSDGAIVMNGEVIAERMTDMSSTYMPLAGGTFSGAITHNATATFAKGANSAANIVLDSGAALSPRVNFIRTASGTSYTASLYFDASGLLNAYGGNGLSAIKLHKPLLVGSAASYTNATTSTIMTNLVVGSTATSRNVTVNGTVTAKSLVQSTTSDERMKDNLIADFDAVSKLAELGEVYAFDYKDEAHTHSYGLIAQNVQQSAEFADMVGQREEDGMYYVNYLDPRLPALLIKAVKQLKAELEGLKSKLSES